MASSTRIREPKHPDTLVAQVQLGDNLSDLGRYAEAAAMICATAQHVFERRSRSLQAGDWRIASVRGEVGLCLRSLRRYGQAEPVLLQATAELEAATGRSAEAARVAATH